MLARDTIGKNFHSEHNPRLAGTAAYIKLFVLLLLLSRHSTKMYGKYLHHTKVNIEGRIYITTNRCTNQEEKRKKTKKFKIFLKNSIPAGKKHG